MLHVTPNLLELLLWHVAELTLIILVVGAGAVAIGRRHPHLAHAIWVVLVIKCLLPPGVTSPLGIVPRLEQLTQHWKAEGPTHRLANHGNTAGTLLVPAQNARPADDPISPRDHSQPAPSVAGSPWTMAEREGHRLLPTLALIAWITGAVFFLVLTIMRWISAWREWLCDVHPTTVELQASANDICQKLKCRRQARVAVSGGRLGPLVIGLFQATIVLPDYLVQRCSKQDLELVLAHEIIHARRGDMFWSVLQWMSQVIWWFHPLVWWANRQLDRTCEVCCDQEVVAGLKCEPRVYARSLLQIVEMRHRLQHLPALPASRPAHITKARLQHLMRPKQAFVSRGPQWIWWSALLFSTTLFPASRLQSAPQQKDVPQQTSASLENAEDAFADQRWAEAIDAYRRLLTDNPHNARYQMRLAYALHAAGRLDEAIEAHQKASEFPQTRSVALYNLACAYSLQHREKEALETLKRAIEAGFRSSNPLSDDSDLASVRNHPSFDRLAALARTDRLLNEYRQLDFWIGSWVVRDAQGQAIGEAEVLQDEKGHLITEKWRSRLGQTGTGISYFDPGQQAWRQTWVDSDGVVSTFTGHFADGCMQFSGTTVYATGTQVLSRSTLKPIDEGRVALVLENSRDDGKTWQLGFDGVYVPKANPDITAQN